MSIFVDENTRVVVQGLTGSQGRFHGLRNRAYGTKVVAGVTPGKGGQDVEGIPIFDTVAEAVAATGADASFVAVPPRGAPAAILDAAAAGIGLVVCITEHIPAKDEALVNARLRREFPEHRLIGPNCPGVISPGKCNIGITAGDIALAGRPGRHRQPVGHLDLPGAARAVPAGRRPDDLRRHRRRPRARHRPSSTCSPLSRPTPRPGRCMMIGEIGGDGEERAADFIASQMDKPVVAYIAGVTAPPGRKMGHAGAIISGSKGTAKAKMEALSAAGVLVAKNPTEAGELMVELVRAL